ncbi:MAG: hypothetical protein KC912_05870 [Proteobacteria bacterium]|nr:hypothetical protein [Pseudomonadota bacterium]
MIALIAMALAGAAEHEENTFALVFQGLEWATPDLRFELGEGPVRTVLSWPVTPVSASVCRVSRCRVHLLAEPYVEPQLRLGSPTTRLLAGSQLLVMSRGKGLGVSLDGAGVYASKDWGWAAGGGLTWGGGANRHVRGRFALRSRYVSVAEASHVELSLDIAGPVSPRGWGLIVRRESVDTEPGFCAPDTLQPVEPIEDCGKNCIEDELPWDPRYEQELLPACDPIGCMPGMCGPVKDGCGGTMHCGFCEEEILPVCDPMGCMPGMCGEFNDCGMVTNCGPCPEELECLPAVCEVGVCGTLPDGCGGWLDCGICDEPACIPEGCQPGTCGAQPDGCGGSLDCGPCGP